MIQTQTFEFNKKDEDELLVLSQALWLIGEKNYDQAAKILIRRHDELTKEKKLKLYDPREAVA